MSKKFNIDRKTGDDESVIPLDSNTTCVPASTEQSRDSAITLINFDRKTTWFLLILLGGFLLFSVLKIHTSNVANWDLYFGKQESEVVIAGKPRFIRLDEWAVNTPLKISQHALGFPIKNPGIGGSNATLLMGMPVKDISTILKPSDWSYFIFDIERAFAFSWNFSIFFFLISMFMLLMLLTRNNFWLSVAGAFFVFFSSAIQWWSYSISTYMIYLNGMLISFIYLLYGKQIRSLIITSLLLCVCIFSFLTSLYPAFQVPLIYLYALILAGYLAREKKFSLVTQKWQIKSAIAVVSLVMLGIILVHYYSLAKDTIAIMMNTTYPGKRFSTGGDLDGGKLFADFFGMFMTDTHVPRQWMNICEASAGIMFFPIILYSLAYHFFKYKKTDLLLVSLSVFVLLLLGYILLGFPSLFSKLSLFSMSTSPRALAVLGVGNSIFLICFLGSNRVRFRKSDFSWIEFTILIAATFIFMQAVSSNINASTENFFTVRQVTMATILFMIAYLLTRYKDMKFAIPLLSVSLLLMTVHNIIANPLTRGLSPVLENPLVKTTREIYQQDPEFGWASYGNNRLAQLLVSTGINTFNGLKFVPPLNELRLLDPDKRYGSVYNKFAWITMLPYIDAEDSVIFGQAGPDGYTIFIDPCSPKLKQLKVKYFLFAYKPYAAEVRCMTEIRKLSQFHIYERRDE